MMTIELNGQGNPLPFGFPYKGEWLLQPRIFLYSLSKEADPPLDKPQFAVEIAIGSPAWSFGFSASAIASQFGVSEDDLFEANRNGQLTLEKVEADTPDGVNATLKIYTLGLFEKTARIEYRRFPAVGRA